MSYGPFGRVAVATAAVASLTACGTTYTATPSPTGTAIITPSTLVSASAKPCQGEPSGVDVPQLSPSGWGPVKLGMTKAEAAATCLLEVDVKDRVCEGTEPLVPKAPYTSSFDIILDRTGRVIDLGGAGKNLETDGGVRVGSSLAYVKAAYPQATGPTDLGGDAAPYHQSGVFIRDGENYLGLLFDKPAAQVRHTDVVRFMEISQGRPPGLFRDAC